MSEPSPDEPGGPASPRAGWSAWLAGLLLLGWTLFLAWLAFSG